jgi:hypothetical protein
MRDSYIKFFSEGYISKEQFFEFGLKETIYAPYEKAERGWSHLKNRIKNNEEVFIRGFGRDANGTHLFQELYQRLVGNDKVKKDSTNNAEPTKIIRELTGYSKTKNSKYELIRNYQISHIFGRTKNIYAFTAPWNIVYMPKMLDPFTGHEAKGEMIDEYTLLFQKQGYERFGRLIDEFNEIITCSSFKDNLGNCLNNLSADSSFENKDIEKLKTAVHNEFMPIEIQA